MPMAAFSASRLAIAGACAVGLVLLRTLSSRRELYRLRMEAEQALLSSDRLAEQLKAERAAAAELAQARDLQLAEVAELKARLESLTAKLDALEGGADDLSSVGRSKVPAALHVAVDRAASRGQLTPISVERKWNTALLRSSLFATDAASEVNDGWVTLVQPKKLAL